MGGWGGRAHRIITKRNMPTTTLDTQTTFTVIRPPMASTIISPFKVFRVKCRTEHYRRRTLRRGHLYCLPLIVYSMLVRCWMFLCIVQPYGAKNHSNCALWGKSTKLGKMIVLHLLNIFSYGPHPNTQGRGGRTCPWGGWGCNQKITQIVHFGVKAPNLAR